MGRRNTGLRRSLAIIIALVMVLTSGVAPLTQFAGVAYAASQDENNPTEVKDWAGLREAVKDGGYIKITQDLVAEGSSIDITKDVHIVGDNATIWRKAGDAKFPMFNVKSGGTLELGNGLTLTGKTCSPAPAGKVEKVEGNHELPEPTTTPGTHTYDSVEERPGEGDQYLYVDVQGGANRFGVTSSKDEAKNYLGAGDQENPKARIYVEGNRIVKEQEGMQKQTLGVNGTQVQFQDNPLNPVRVADNGELWYNNTSWRIVFENGALAARSSGTPVTVVSSTPLSIITDGGSGGGTTTVWTVNGVEYTNKDDADAALAEWNEQDSTNVWTVNGVEYTTKEEAEAALAAWNEEDSYWTVDGEGHYDTEAEANAAAGGQGCDGGCNLWKASDISSGSVDAPKGFFAQVEGTLNITGATITNFITEKNVSNVAPIVVNGGKFNMSGGTINHNEVGYSANDSYISKPANDIEEEIKKNWTRTNTAGAAILTNGAEATLTGGTIEHNRADTGAIVVQGNGSNSVSGTQSNLSFTGGTINNNIGVHYGGGLYVYNNGLVEMGSENGSGNGTLKDNFAWNKGGAVFVSEEVYGSTQWNKPGTTIPVGDAVFVLYGGTISGNMAVSRAGGIEVMSNHVILINGDIVNNSSRVLGGAIYVEGDGVDRMYTLVMRKGCISNNTAVKKTPQPKTLSRVFKGTGDQCTKDNILGAPGAGTAIYDDGDYGGYYGYGGGIWLCSFGGNVTFNMSDKFNVIVDGNEAGTEGTDIQVHIAKNNSPNGVHIVGVGDNNFVNEKTGKALEVGVTYPGKLSIENTNGRQGCNGIDGVNISGNVASNGGGIAANGTVVFGEDTNVYAPMTNIRLSKTWGEGMTPEKINLKYYYKDEKGNRKTIKDLEGYEVTFDQIADEKGQSQADNVYTENDPTWEQIDNEGNSFADIAIPWVVTVDGVKKPTFIIGVDNDVTIDYKDAKNNDRTFKGKEFDPSNEEHIAALWTGINNKTIDGKKVKILKWNLEVVETNADGEEIEYQLPNGEVMNLEVKAHDQEKKTFYDKAKHELASINTAALGFNFGTDIANEGPEEPEVEKYINNKVHQSLDAFDEEFEYAIMAYVPKDATEAIISDTLEDTLEFVNKTRSTVLSTLQILKDNDHKGDGNGTVKTNQVDGTNVKTRDADKVRKGERTGCPLKVDGNTVSLTLDKGFIDEVKAKDTNGQGFWVKMTFKAKYNLDYIKAEAGEKSWLNFVEGDDSWLDDDADKSGGAKLLYIQNNGEARWNPGGNRYILLVDGVYYRSNPLSKGDKATTWEQHPNQSQWAGGDFAPLEVMDASVIDGDVSKIKLPEGAVTYNGNVVEAKEPHHGTKNQGEFTVKRGNNSESTHKTNEVTVEPKNVKFEAEKKWLDEKGQATEWPKDAKITFTLWKINKDNTEEELESKEISSFEKVEFKEQPKLNSARYEVRETVTGIQAQVSDIKTETKDATDDRPETTTTTFTNKISDEPEVEKYVNNKVHVNLENFDEVFEYSIMGFVPADATEVTITDELVPDLRFVDADGNIQGVDAGFDSQNVVVNKSGFHGLVIEGSTNNHNANGSGTVTGHNKAWFDNNPGRMLSDMLDKVKVEGNKISITINKDMMDAHANAKYDKGTTDNDLRGKHIILSFKAAINPASYNKVLQQIAAGENESADTSLGLEWKKIENDESSIDSEGVSHSKVFNGKDVESDGSHAGIINKANFKVTINDDGTFDYDTNTVTVKPKTQELEVEKTWAGTDGNKWPEEVSSVTFGLFKTKEGVEEPESVKGSVDEEGKYTTGTDDAVIELTSEKTKVKVTGLPKLEGVTYSAREIKVGDDEVAYNDTNTAGVLKQGDVVKYIVKMIREKLAGSKIDNKFIATNSAPAIEKYVNQKVHAELEAFDTEFTYDIMAYVPAGSTKITISDELKPQLVLKSTKAEIEESVVSKEKNDHKVESSVKQSGTAIKEGVTATIDSDNPNKVDIEVINSDGALDGMWVQATLKAEISSGAYEDVLKQLEKDNPTEANEAINWAKITENAPVIDGEKPHSGLVNKASYKIEVGNQSSSVYESNEVTVVPNTVSYAGEKAWTGLEGDETWPKDVTVKFNLVKVSTNEAGETAREIVASVELKKGEETKDFPKQPKLEGVTYEVEEETVAGYMITNEETKTEDGKTTVTITNKPEKPEIEKYINKNVHKFINLEETFTYDIIGYITQDAIEVGFIDVLNENLQFKNGGDVKVTVTDLGTDVDHKPNGSVSKKGKDITSKAEIQVSVETRSLTVRLDEATSKSVRGHWVRVTFDAELNSDLVEALKNGTKTIDDLNQVEVIKGKTLQEDVDKERPAENNGNLPVITEEEHDGVPNTSEYIIRPEGDGLYWDKSNTVTVKPEKPEIEKYINQNVHQFIGLDDTFTYDIIAYVTNDADQVEITDTLVNDLEFVSQAGDIVVRDLGETVDHTPYGSVSENGEQVKSSAKIDGKTLTITIGDAKPHRGHWVKATFVAKLDQSVVDAINAGEKQISELMNTEIKNGVVLQEDESRAETKKGNLPVITEEEHDGVPNTSSYRIKVGNEYKYNDKSNTVTVKPEKPELEKYINKNVHEFVALDEVFTYDIIAYVPNDADELTITDDLDEQLQFAKGKDGANVKVFDIGTTNNHKTGDKATEDKVDASVNNTDKPITGDATITATDGKLKVVIANTISNIDNNTGVITYSKEKLSPYRGHYIRVQFDAQLADNVDINNLTTVEITENEPLDVTEDQKSHDGIENKSMYTVKVGNDGKYGTESNTVTVTPEEPSIEKYVNNDVHWDMSEFDRLIKYDILVFVPHDAEKLQIKDTLVNALEFANGKGNAEEPAVASSNKDEVVTSIVAKPENNHKVKGTVSETGGEALGDKAKVTIDKQNLLIEIDDAKPYHGSYIQVTFWAKYTDKIIEAVKIEDTDTITSNGAVLEGVEEHYGTINRAAYSLYVNNEWSSDYESNTVTVEPKTVVLEAEKQWQDIAGEEMSWPDEVEEVVINIINTKKNNEVVDTIVLNSLETKKSKELPKLVGVEYALEEVSVPGYLTTTEDGKLFVNKKNTILIPVIKTWDDNADFDGRRTISVVMNLLQDGEIFRSLTITNAAADSANPDVWYGAFTDVPYMDEEGHVYEYTVEEVPVAYYLTEYSGSIDTEFKVTNIHRPWFPEIPETPGEEASFVIKKETTGAAETDKVYNVEISLTFPPEYVAEGEEATYTYTMELKPGEEYTVDKLPAKTQVTIKETSESSKGYEVSYLLNGKDCKTVSFEAETSVVNRVVVINYKAPEKPEKPDKPKEETPKTGDESNMMMWISLAGLAGATTVVMATRRRRNYK